MKGICIHQVDVFTKERFSGNPAGVVTNANGLSHQQMQIIARELNNSETAFILSPEGPDHDVWLRFFTPTTEVPSCGHATIAAHYIRALEQDLGPSTVVQKIGAGILPVDIERDGDDIRIVMTQGTPTFSPELEPDETRRLLDALGLANTDRDPRCPIRIASTGHSKVMIGIHSRKTLDTLKPNLADLTALSVEISCNGYYVFTLSEPDAPYLIHGRMFAPAIGIAEDPVTGNANGPLGTYLVEQGLSGVSDGLFHFKARQGEAMGRPGEMEVLVDVKNGHPECVRIAGHAISVFKTVL